MDATVIFYCLTGRFLLFIQQHELVCITLNLVLNGLRYSVCFFSNLDLLMYTIILLCPDPQLEIFLLYLLYKDCLRL